VEALRSVYFHAVGQSDEINEFMPTGDLP
jgi:hypothetical protein